MLSFKNDCLKSILWYNVQHNGPPCTCKHLQRPWRLNELSQLDLTYNAKQTSKISPSVIGISDLHLQMRIGNRSNRGLLAIRQISDQIHHDSDHWVFKVWLCLLLNETLEASLLCIMAKVAVFSLMYHVKDDIKNNQLAYLQNISHLNIPTKQWPKMGRIVKKYEEMFQKSHLLRVSQWI